MIGGVSMQTPPTAHGRTPGALSQFGTPTEGQPRSGMTAHIERPGSENPNDALLRSLQEETNVADTMKDEVRVLQEKLHRAKDSESQTAHAYKDFASSSKAREDHAEMEFESVCIASKNRERELIDSERNLEREVSASAHKAQMNKALLDSEARQI